MLVFISNQLHSIFGKRVSKDGFYRYFKNVSWLFASKIVSMSVSLLTTIYVARHLGPTNYGQLSYAVSFTGLFSFISSLGIGSVLFRDLIKFPKEKEKILGTSFVLIFISGTITAVICSIFSFLITKDDVSKVLIFILSGTFILTAFQLPLVDFQSRADSKYPSIITVFVTFILNILKIITIAFGGGVIYLASILLLESILYAISYIFIYKKNTLDNFSEWTFDRVYAKSILKDSLPFIVLGAFSVIYARIDQVFIKHMIDATSVGIYDSAVRISEVWSFIPVITLAALYPAIVNAKKISEDKYNNQLGLLAIFFFTLSVVIAIPVTFFAPFIIKKLYGVGFILAVPVLKIYIWANVGMFLSTLINQYLLTENFRKILSFIAFIPMICNVILNLLWIPIYGIEGAAYATLISYSLMPLSLFLFKETRLRIFAIYKSL